MKSIQIWLGKYIYPLFLIFLVGILAWVNYTPGTSLIGWDNLHPEFNFSLSFERMLSGVWRADQGLGAVAGHSHMADLVRVAFLWIGSLFLAPDKLRYAFYFLTLLLGTLGVYALISYLLKKDHRHQLYAFIGGLLYLTNLGTVQYFIVPFEMFAAGYAVIPWILWAGARYIDQSDRKGFVLYIIIAILSAPMAYAATLWYATFLGVAMFFLMYKRGKSAFVLIATLLLVNAYWILPNLYFIKTHGQEVQESKINRLFSPEAFAKGQVFGNPVDTMALKNFLFDWQILNPETGRFEQVLEAWQEHLKNPIIAAFPYLVFALAAVGLVTSARRQKLVALVPTTILAFGVILNGTWPIDRLFASLEVYLPVAKEALRFPFTKFSLLAMIGLSFYASLGLRALGRFIVPIALAVSVYALVFFLPAFDGKLIHPALRIQIPNEYFQMFDFFASQRQDQRVAILPIHSFWAWTYYDWGYQGAGFLQFGVPQPILDRDYDRWSLYNEQYQKEMSYAVYSQNPELVGSVLGKYDIRWVLVDSSVTAPGMLENAVLTWRIPDILLQTGLITETKRFGGNIVIYEVRHDSSAELTQSILPLDVLTKNERYVGNEIGELVFEASSKTPDVFGQARTCGYTNKVTIGSRTFTESSVRYESINTPLCDSVSLPGIDHDRGYVVEIESNNESGFPLELCISNNLTSHCDLFEHLHESNQYLSERFLILPLRDYGSGYTLNFNNFTIRGRASVNNIKSIKIYIYPNQKTVSTSSEVSVQGMFILSQAFDPGWTAWERISTFPYLRPLSNHVLVNNWENGWTYKGDAKNIVVFFWPQMLQWIGFGLLPIPFLWAMIYLNYGSGSSPNHNQRS